MVAIAMMSLGIGSQVCLDMIHDSTANLAGINGRNLTVRRIPHLSEGKLLGFLWLAPILGRRVKVTPTLCGSRYNTGRAVAIQ